MEYGEYKWFFVSVLLAGLWTVAIYFLLHPGERDEGGVSVAHQAAPANGWTAAEPLDHHHHEKALAEVVLADVRGVGIYPGALTRTELARQLAAATAGLGDPLVPAGQCDRLRAVPPAERAPEITAALLVCSSMPEAKP